VAQTFTGSTGWLLMMPVGRISRSINILTLPRKIQNFSKNFKIFFFKTCKTSSFSPLSLSLSLAKIKILPERD
jgi:hypothetical protein